MQKGSFVQMMLFATEKLTSTATIIIRNEKPRTSLIIIIIKKLLLTISNTRPTTDVSYHRKHFKKTQTL